jgi:hypothetical protein
MWIFDQSIPLRTTEVVGVASGSGVDSEEVSGIQWMIGSSAAGGVEEV